MNQVQETFLEQPLDVYCGTKTCRPQFLQRCANIKAFIFFASISGLLTFSLTIYLGSQVTAIEKHFNFNSSQSGFLLSCNDIGFLVSVLIFSYILKNSHVPRVIGISSVVYGISGLLCAVPYFFSPVPFINTTNQTNQTDSTSTATSLCESGNSPSNNTLPCQKSGNNFHSNQWALAVMATGMIIQGFAKAPRTPLQTSYIDDSVEKNKFNAYMGTFLGVSILGPALAFMFGSLFSSLYVTLKDTELTPQDSHWIGAWWLGFIFFGLLSIVSSIPLFFFPKRLQPKDNFSVVNEKESFEKIVSTTKRLILNPLFMSMCILSILRSFMVSGLVAYMPKYFETQFQLPSWKTNLIIGCSFVLTASFGSIGGGILTSHFKIGPKGSIKFLIIVNVFALILLWFCIAVTCPQPEFTQTRQNISHAPLSNKTFEPGLNCLTCECDEYEYDPVCGEDGRNFLSPCMAGCQRKSSTGFGYESCSCVGGNQTAFPGTCPIKCNGAHIVAAALSIRSFIESLTIGPNTLITLRSVLVTDRTFAMGLLAFLSSILGWLPGPPSHGALIDTFCTKWRHLPCNMLGACTEYDVTSFRIGFFSLQGGLHLASDIFIIIIAYYGLRSKRYFQNEKEK